MPEYLNPPQGACGSSVMPLITTQEAAIFCLGVYTGAVLDAEFRKITVDYTVEFARVLRRQPRHGLLIPERERRGPDETKPDGLCTL